MGNSEGGWRIREIGSIWGEIVPRGIIGPGKRMELRSPAAFPWSDPDRRMSGAEGSAPIWPWTRTAFSYPCHQGTVARPADFFVMKPEDSAPDRKENND